MKYKLTFFIGCIIIVFSALSYYTIKSYQADLSFAIIEKRDIENKLQKLTDKYESTIFNNGHTINDLSKVRDTSFAEIPISLIIENGKRLCFYFEENMCSSCVIEQMDRLSTLTETIGKEKIIIFTSLKNDKKLPHLNRIYNQTAQFFLVDDKLLFNTRPAKSTPALFILDEWGRINHFYHPETGQNKLNNHYYNNIINHL